MANTTLSLDLLPVECLSQICSLLDHISLVQISLTCKQLWFVANNDKIWENRFKYDFKQFYIENSYPSEWKQQYLNRIKRSRPYWKQESSYLSTLTPTQLRRLFLFYEDTDKPLDQITRFKESKTWKENIVLEALRNELKLQNPNPEKVALFTKYIFYLRQKKRKPFMENLFDSHLFCLLATTRRRLIVAKEKEKESSSSSMKNFVESLKILFTHGANAFAQKTVSELIHRVSLPNNILTTNKPHVLVIPRYLARNETLQIIEEAEKKQKMILLAASGKYTLQQLKDFFTSYPNERYLGRPFWINSTCASWPFTDRKDIPPHWTPLHCAAARGDVEMLDFLLRNGAKIYLLADNKTALDIAKERGQHSAVAFLETVWQRYLKLKSLTTDFLMHLFTTHNDDSVLFETNVKEVERLTSTDVDPYRLSYDLDLNSFSGFVSSTKGTLLHAISEANLPQILHTIITKWPEWIKIIGITRRDVDGNSALHIASRNGHTEVVQLLLQEYTRFMKHFHINKRNHLLLTPLELALSNGHLDTARVLLESGCYYQTLFVRSLNSSYFFHHGKLRECGELLKQYCRGHFPSVFKLMGSKSLYFACLHKNYDFVKWVFEQLDKSYSTQELQWFDINQQFDIPAFKKPTLLHVAAQGGDERIIRLLHQHGARWGTDNLCQTPLHYAFLHRNKKAMETLGELYRNEINDIEGLLKGDCDNFESVLFNSLNSPAINWVSSLLFRESINPYTVKNEQGRTLVEELHHRINNLALVKNEEAQKILETLQRLVREVGLVIKEVERQCGLTLETALLRGDRKTAQEMFEFAKGRSKRQRILSLNPLVCYEAARRGTLDLILQYLEYFPGNNQELVLNDMMLAAIEANLEDFVVHKLLSFDSFKLKVLDETARTWLKQCLLLRRRNIFKILMNVIIEPQNSPSLSIELQAFSWIHLMMLAAKLKLVDELDILLQYGTNMFPNKEGTSFGLEGLFRMEDFIVVAYSSQNKEVIELLKKYNFAPPDLKNSETKDSTKEDIANAEPCECQKESCKWSCGLMISRCLEENHSEVCLKRKLTCPIEECKKQMAPAHFAFHMEKECEYLVCKDCYGMEQKFLRYEQKKHWEVAHQQTLPTECQFCGQQIPSSTSNDYYSDRVLILNNNNTLNHLKECAELFLYCYNCQCSVPYREWKQHRCSRVGRVPPRTHF